MIQFNKPENLNGLELLDELAAVGIVLDKMEQAPVLESDGSFWLDIEKKDEVKALAVVEAHNGTIVAPEATITDKLATLGLSIDDLKAALGL